MGEFRIGAKFARHTYPDNPRAAALGVFSRNFATGPKITTDIGGGIHIPWNAVDVPPAPTAFTVVANTVTVHISGDVTAQFVNGDVVDITPTAPAPLPTTPRTIVSPPSFGGVFTTFDLNSTISISTTAGTLVNRSNVPITPRSTGVVLVSGVVTVVNPTDSPLGGAIVLVQVNNSFSPSPASTVAPLAAGQEITLPFLVEVVLTVGVTSNIEVFMSGNGAALVGEGSSIEVQEVSVATG